mmetsp:Transcript_10995/g.12615  ORF Transcript_10995/g.12615 Transcript_10995/m.12615 type:complete len:102 (+) Transcript_10995:533-838(+)
MIFCDDQAQYLRTYSNSGVCLAHPLFVSLQNSHVRSHHGDCTKGTSYAVLHQRDRANECDISLGLTRLSVFHSRDRQPQLHVSKSSWKLEEHLVVPEHTPE